MIRWGILGTGRMAHALAATIAGMPDGEVVAVASRRSTAAEAFATRHGIDGWLDSYDALAGADGIDAVYVATTNEHHLPNTLACLAAGKAVLCEKPLAVDLGQVEQMVAAARRHGTFLMEAMWMRFQPFLAKTRELIAEGRIGPVRLLHADFGFPADTDPQRRWFDPDQGGGALLDLGIYPLMLALTLLGEPESVASAALTAETGVDAQLGAVLRHPGGALAVLSASLVADTATEATVSGPEGRLRIHSPFHHSRHITVHRPGEEVVAFDVEDAGYLPEVEEVHRCLRSGQIESRVMSHRDSLMLMRWMDALRAEWSTAVDKLSPGRGGRT